MNDARELLAAGAILPLGTEDAGEEAVPLTARKYRHPVLEGRAVVRLVTADLGGGEDQAAEFLGFEREKEPVTVGLGRHGTLGFPEWVLVHHPEDGHHALDIVPEIERIAQRATVKPKAALDAFRELAGRLASSVPHLLPSFYERAAREFLAAGNLAYAGQLFDQARKTETEHSLPIDEERLDTVFLEFALAGALTVKALCAYGRELSHRVPADEALRRFTELCVRRTAAGLEPPQVASELRRLARAAGVNVQAAEGAYLAEMLVLPVTVNASAGWWRTHRRAVAALAEERPEFRGTLLNMKPSDEEVAGLWLEMLEESGAVAALFDPEGVPEEARPEGGGVGWLNRFVGCFWGHQWNGVPVPALHGLVERMADRLKTELTARGEGLAPTPHVDLLDLLLELGVPVADPGPREILYLENWANAGERRDLLALAADPRFADCFHHNVEWMGDSGKGVFRMLAAAPGGRLLLARWMASAARRSIAPGLPGLPEPLDRLIWLPVEVLALAEDEVREAAAADLAPVLARTLRAGLFDELGWPAWEEAVEQLSREGETADMTIADAWPELIVAGRRQVRVIGAQGVVLTHDVRIPPQDSYRDPGFCYVDGELLVHWCPGYEDDRVGYWHTTPDRSHPITGHVVEAKRMYWYCMGRELLGLPLPGGGRTTGAGVVRRGDAVLPPSREVIGDGTSYWSWFVKEGGEAAHWYEYDPESGEYGRRGMPAFLADATRGLPDRSTLASGRLLPLPSKEATPVGTPVDGALGWRAVQLPDGSYRGEDLAGNTVIAPEGSPPFHVLFFPGDDRPRALVKNGYRRLELVDSDGVVTARVEADEEREVFSSGTRLLPPVQYWHCMRPRDPRGSEALRRIDGETVAELLKAASHEEDLAEAVRRLVPDVTHEALITAIVGVVRFAADQRETLDAVVRRLESVSRKKEVADPSDRLINAAVEGLGYGKVYLHGDEKAGALRALRKAALSMAAGDLDEDSLPALHLDGPLLAETTAEIPAMVGGVRSVAYRAVSALNAPENREALAALLAVFGELGLIGDEERHGRWRRFLLRLDRETVEPYEKERTRNGNGLLAMKDGAFMAVVDHEIPYYSKEFHGFFYDPSGRFELPAAYEVFSSEPVSELEDALLAARLMAEAAARGPAPWFPEAAEEFARLTGVTPTMARLVVAGLPNIDRWDRDFLPSETRAALGLKVADAAAAKEELVSLDAGVRRAVVAALVPSEQSRLWTGGPDVSAAAEVWNTEVGRRVAVPEEIMAEAVKEVRTDWKPGRAMPALLDPPSAPELSRDMDWTVRNYHARPVEEGAAGFNAAVLVGAAALTAWLAHRLPAGDPLRERLPASLAAVSDRLAHPGLLLALDKYVDHAEFCRGAGDPLEKRKSFSKYGAVVVPRGTGRSFPAIDPALLDEEGNDPYMTVLRGLSSEACAVGLAVRLVRDERFAALLADPGDPAAGERAADGTWWPQDPSRSVPDLVAEASGRYGLSPDAAAVYLMLLAMPDPTDKNTARWTGWRPARLKAARAELAGTDLVVEARRSRAGRSSFLPCGWSDLRKPPLPLEEWKLPLYVLSGDGRQPAPLGVVVPAEPVGDLYRRAWKRILDEDGPRFADLEVRRGRRR